MIDSRKPIHLLVFLLFSCLFSSPTYAQQEDMETLLNRVIHTYPFSIDNQFKLAAYAEMKGRYTPSDDALAISFGNLGTMTFYANNCLLRTEDQRIYHLNQTETDPQLIGIINERLDRLFEKIILLSNYHASIDLIEFVDKGLARKNIEPFDKIYLRHILLKYGSYHPEEGYVEFHSDLLPDQRYTYRKPGDSSLVQRHVSPVKIRLDRNILRGYYIRAGGTVYLENVDREVAYATGEELDPNVTAFKVFAQKLFIQSVQYITRKESERIEKSHELEGIAASEEAFHHSTFFPPETASKRPVAQKVSLKSNAAIEPLYHHFSWIPMMLGMLRTKGISVGNPEILVYFKDQPYFPDIYRQMTPKEQKQVDKQMQ